MMYQKIIELRNLLKQDIYQKRTKGRNKILEKFVGDPNITNTFFTLFDYLDGAFTFHCNVEKYTGYLPKEFTISAINNHHNATYKIIHPDDIEHKLRYDYLVLVNLMNRDRVLEPMKDSYEIFMRIVLKDGTIKRVIRQSFTFDMDENKMPTSQLDIWKIIPNHSEYVNVGLNYDGWDDVYEIFYQKNRSFLNFELSKRHIEIIKLKMQRKDQKTIAEILNVSPKTIENHLDCIKQKIRLFCHTKNLDTHIYTSNDIIHFIKKWGIINDEFQ